MDRSASDLEFIPRSESMNRTGRFRVRRPAPASPRAGHATLLLTALILALATTAVTAPPAGAQGLRTIVLDPGHGGSETGAIGPSGVMEKDVALDIAVRLRDLIRARLGIMVFLTREADVDRTLEERTALANNRSADVFLSIHANSYRGRGVRGAETFFLSDRATDERARQVAALENRGSGPDDTAGADPGLELLLWDMAQTAHLRDSSALAEMVQRRLNRLADTGDRGIKQAPFRVLKGANMPAALVEVGFLSNPDEEARLADPGYRQRVAEELFQSLEEFRQRQDRLTGGSR